MGSAHDDVIDGPVDLLCQYLDHLPADVLRLGGPHDAGQRADRPLVHVKTKSHHVGHLQRR
jgi:hypothetical protein